MAHYLSLVMKNLVGRKLPTFFLGDNMSENPMVTLDSLDDSLIERKQKEIKRLKEENDELRIKLSHMTDAKDKWNNRYIEMVSQKRAIEQENRELAKKILRYEHDPIKMEICNEDDAICFDILYWNSEKNNYDLFGVFYENQLEGDMEEFCKEFIMELKDAYMVE